MTTKKLLDKSIILKFLTEIVRKGSNNHSAVPSAAVHAAVGVALLALAADGSSAVLPNSPATPVVAGARGDSPREVDPSLMVDFECESNEMADSGSLHESPGQRQAADFEPSIKRARSRSDGTKINRTMFGSDDEDDPPSSVPSPNASPAPISVRSDDDGVSHRKKSSYSTPASVGTTHKMFSWYPCLSGYQSQKLAWYPCFSGYQSGAYRR